VKNALIFFSLALLLLSCNKDEETVEPTPTATDTEALTQLVVVVGGDTLRTDSVYTKTSATGGYQMTGVDSLGRHVVLKIFRLQGEALYPTVFGTTSNEFLRNSIELIDYDGAAWSTLSDPEGFINVTDYSVETQTISGQFAGTLQNTDGLGEALTIDTAYFENVRPMVLNTESGKADLFKKGKLTRGWETTAVLSASHHLRMESVEDPYGEGFYLTVNDATPTSVTTVFFLEGQFCYPIEHYYNIEFPLEVDYANQTVSGEIRDPFSDEYIYFNQVSVTFPDFPIPSGQLNLSYNGTVTTFEEYSIESTSGTITQVVNFSAWSSSGAYLEGTLSNDWWAEPWTCNSLFFEGSISLFENENSPTPLATFQGFGNLTQLSSPDSLAEMGFTSDEAELGGVDLEVVFVE
jgi:hypothetical protein